MTKRRRRLRGDDENDTRFVALVSVPALRGANIATQATARMDLRGMQARGINCQRQRIAERHLS